jgi:hypothetical protein
MTMIDRRTEVCRDKDGHSWQIGGDAGIAWIRENTDNSRTITCAIPPQFPAYASLEQPGGGGHDPQSWFENRDRHDAGVLTVLTENTPAQPWWLGYLDTGGADVIFYDVPKVSLFPTHDHVVIEAGPGQAGAWRAPWNRWKGILPDLIFPADRAIRCHRPMTAPLPDRLRDREGRRPPRVDPTGRSRRPSRVRSRPFGSTARLPRQRVVIGRVEADRSLR